MLGPSISSSHKDLSMISLAGGIFSRARSRCGHGRGEAANMAVSRHPTQRLIDQHPSTRQEEATLREHWFMRTILRLQIKKSISSPWARSRYPKQGVHVSHRVIGTLLFHFAETHWIRRFISTGGKLTPQFVYLNPNVEGSEPEGVI